MTDSYRTGRIHGDFQVIVITLKSKDMEHTIKNRKYLKHDMKIPPYLTKQRETTLEQCRQLQEQYSHFNAIDYIFSDVDGNLYTIYYHIIKL